MFRRHFDDGTKGFSQGLAATAACRGCTTTAS